MTEKVILNLGCGETIIPDAINVDQIEREGIIKADVFDYLKSVKKHSVDEIHLYYLLEHLTLTELLEFTYYLNRALKLNGRIFGMLPDFDAIVQTYDGSVEWFFKYHYEVCSTRETTLHASLWNENFLNFIFERDGFKLVRIVKNTGTRKVGMFFELLKVENNGGVSVAELKKIMKGAVFDTVPELQE